MVEASRNVYYDDVDYYMGGRMTTGQLAEKLGVTEPFIQSLIRNGKLVRPEKVRGKRVWAKKDVENARAAVAANS